MPARDKATRDKTPGSRPRTTVIFKTWEEKRGKLVPQKRARTKPSKPEVKLGAKRLALAPDLTNLMNSFWEVLDDSAPVEGGQSILEEEEDWYDVDEPEKAPDPDPAPTSNVYLRRWREEHLPKYVSALLLRDAAPPSLECSVCHKQNIEVHRCQSCLGAPLLCGHCLVSAHIKNPTHIVRAWNGQFWQDASLSALGLVIDLGHQGSACPVGHSVSCIWVGDLGGFSEVKVRLCRCDPSPDAPRGLQLLELNIFPCSDTSPQSGFTVALLKQFRIFSTLGKGSAHKFYSILERSTKPGFPAELRNRYRELLVAHRKFGYASLLKRSGRAHPKHPKPAFEDDLTIACPACPNPQVNFRQEEVAHDELPFFRYWMSYDGNFRNPRKAKKVLNDDVCLTDGDMYYVEQTAYKNWVNSKTGQEPSTEKNRPECDNHKAAQDKFVRWGGLDITGVGAYTCARHSMFLPRAFVDFQKGERFAYGDYGFGSVVNWLGRHGQLSFGLTYDIWCHWIVRLKERASHFPKHIALPSDLDLVGGIPKFHLQGHENLCWVRYSLNNMRYVGRIEGEGIERAWAHLNETSGSTSEKSPGARWDSINLILGDWNFEKTIRMASFLCAKFQEAKKVFPRQRDTFVELDESLPNDMTDLWRSESTQPVKLPSGKWSSPFEPAEVASEKFQEAIHRQASKETDSGSDPSRKSGVVKWISSAIELENSRDTLRREIQKMGSNLTPRQHNSINDKRKALNERINSHRAKQVIFMGDIGPPDHPGKPEVIGSDPEHAELGLPSSYGRDTLETHSLFGLAEVEIQLRRARCNDALETIKNLLGAKAAVLKFKKANLRGERATTRAEAAIREHAEQLSRVQSRYNNSRAALLRLSQDPSDVSTYQYLKKEDLKQLNCFLEEDSRSLGQGYQEIPWIWRSIAAPNQEDWQIKALKTEWFRARQRCMQWEEELKLLKREMVMTIRDFSTRAEIWKSKADLQASSGLVTPGVVEYARRKSDFFTRVREDALSRCLPSIKDPIVELAWASNWVKSLETQNK